MAETKQKTEKPESEKTEKAEQHEIAINDRTVILLLVLFTLMIAGWWILNLYMGRWI